MTNPANRGACDERCAGYAFSLADKTDRGGKTAGAPGEVGSCSEALDGRTLGFACAPPLIGEQQLTRPRRVSVDPSVTDVRVVVRQGGWSSESGHR